MPCHSPNNEITDNVGQDKPVHEVHKVYDSKHGEYVEQVVEKPAKSQAPSTVSPFTGLRNP